MTIDLDRCTGCGACVTACQAENNTADRRVRMRTSHAAERCNGYESNVIGKASTRMRRLRFHTDVVPALRRGAVRNRLSSDRATYHNQDGLNAQVYNRCIGTRSCAVYCPVRSPLLQLLTIMSGTHRSISS